MLKIYKATIFGLGEDGITSKYFKTKKLARAWIKGIVGSILDGWEIEEVGVEE